MMRRATCHLDIGRDPVRSRLETIVRVLWSASWGTRQGVPELSSLVGLLVFQGHDAKVPMTGSTWKKPLDLLYTGSCPLFHHVPWSFFDSADETRSTGPVYWGPTSHTSLEPWLWNCESPREKCPKAVLRYLQNRVVCGHGPSRGVWNRHMWPGPQPNAISMNGYSRMSSHMIK